MSEGAFRNRVWRYRLATAGTVAFCLLVVAFALWRSGTFEECFREIPYQEATKQYGESLPLFLFLIGEWFGCLGPFIDKNADPIIAVFTLVLAIATIRLWIATNRLWEGAERSSERQLRAYVCLNKTSVVIDKDNFPKINFVVTNFGQTPAYEWRQWHSAVLTDFPLSVDLPPIKDLPTVPGSIIGPTDSRHLYGNPLPEDIHAPLAGNRRVTSDELRALRNGSKALYVYGEGTYRDAFGNQRFLRFRVMTGGPLGLPADGRTIDCHEGNEAN